MKKILSKPSRRVVLKAEAVDGKLKRVRCCMHVDTNDIAALDNAINELTKFRGAIKDRYND